MKLKKNDQIIIVAGKDKGKKGKIEKVLIKRQRVLVPGVNIFKRHMKKRDEKNPGGIIEFPRPLPLASVRLICPKCGKPTRVGYHQQGDTKQRVCKLCSQAI